MKLCYLVLPCLVSFLLLFLLCITYISVVNQTEVCCSTVLYFKFYFCIDRSAMTNNKYTIPPEKKWMSLFAQCRQALGCCGDRDPDLKVVWQSISVALTSKHDSKLSHGEQEIIQELLNINNEMVQTAKVTVDLQKLHLYLTKVRLARK